MSARTAAPVVGGLWSCMFLTLLACQPRTPCGVATGACAHSCVSATRRRHDIGRCGMNRLKLAELTSGGSPRPRRGPGCAVSAVVRTDCGSDHRRRSLLTPLACGTSTAGGTRSGREVALGRGPVLGVLAAVGWRAGDVAVLAPLIGDGMAGSTGVTSYRHRRHDVPLVRSDRSRNTMKSPLRRRRRTITTTRRTPVTSCPETMTGTARS